LFDTADDALQHLQRTIEKGSHDIYNAWKAEQENGGRPATNDNACLILDLHNKCNL
jgi:hypothetical protein